MLRTGYGMFYAKTTNSTYYATRVENGVYPADVQLHAPTHLPGADVPQRHLDPARAGDGGAVRRRADAAGDDLHAAVAPPRLTRGMSPDWVNPRGPRRRRHRGTPVAGRPQRLGRRTW